MNGESEEASVTSATFNQQQYMVGEFVYVDRSEPSMAPHICLIEKIYTDKNGEQTMYINKFLRPVDTFHVSSRKFLESEV